MSDHSSGISRCEHERAHYKACTISSKLLRNNAFHMWKWQVGSLIALGLMCGCANLPAQQFKVQTSLMPFSELQRLKEGQREILDKTKEQIVAEYGRPEEVKEYEIQGKMRERYSYHFMEEDFLNRKLLLDIYFTGGVVTGYNIYSGDRPSEQQETIAMTDKFVFGAL